jgi:hypothetical protein
MEIWYIFRRFGMLYQEKSGNPATEPDQIYCPLQISFPATADNDI